MNKNNQR